MDATGRSILGIALTIARNAERLVLTIINTENSKRNNNNNSTFLAWKAITILLFNNNNNQTKTFLTWNAGMLVLPWCKPGPLSTPVKSGSATITMNDGTGNNNNDQYGGGGGNNNNNKS